MRKSIVLSATLFALTVLLSAPPSFALSVDRDTGMNSDGTAKFADPDDEMPNFMNGPPEDQAPAHATPSVLLPMTPNGSAGFSVNRFGGGSQAPDAFDQAYDRK